MPERVARPCAAPVTSRRKPSGSPVSAWRSGCGGVVRVYQRTVAGLNRGIANPQGSARVERRRLADGTPLLGRPLHKTA